MDNRDDSEKDAKISDSACSNCSNSQSRRSQSSKSTRSGSNSSGSSGYGGKQSGSGCKIEPKLQKEKQANRKRAFDKPALWECTPPEPLNEVKNMNEDKLEGMDMEPSTFLPEVAVDNIFLSMSQDQTETDEEGFCCAISMRSGIVMYTTKSLYQILGFPKDMWIGMSFIDFLHPRDRNTFSSQITNNLATQKIVKTDPTEQEEKRQPTTDVQECMIACRIRGYKTLSGGFAIKNRGVPYVPFVLKLLFKDIKHDNDSTVYLIIKATRLYPAYKSPNELLDNPASFVIRQSATGALDHIDIESVPYLGYMPQDVHKQDVMMMYHPDDLPLLKTAYETIVKHGGLAKSMPYRIMAQNGDYVKLKTEWTSFSNPWSLKLEFIIGKHYVLEGPTTPDVFKAPPPPPDKTEKLTEEKKQKNENNLTMLKKVLHKPAETAKQQVPKYVEDVATFMDTLLDEPKVTEELKIDIQEVDLERDSVILGAISPDHDYIDNDSGTGTPLSYNQLNYNENIERYFNSRIGFGFDACMPSPTDSNDQVFEQKWMAESTVPSPSCMPSTADSSTESTDVSSPSLNFSTSPASPGYLTPRLTESLMKKHNNEMESELAKIHREGRSTHKTDRTADHRLKTKEHLARCKAGFNPTDFDIGLFSPPLKKCHLKNTEDEIPAMQPCLHKTTEKPAQFLPSPPPCHHGNRRPIHLPLTEFPIIPEMGKETFNAHSAINRDSPQFNQLKYQPPLMPSSFMQPEYGYSGSIFPPTMPLSVQQQNQQMMAYSNETPPTPINLTIKKSDIPKDQTEEAVPSTSFKVPELIVEKVAKTADSSDEKNCITDEGSSYSSFYSSFLKTESTSTSSNPRKPRLQLSEKEDTYVPIVAKNNPQSKRNPPWNQVPERIVEKVAKTADSSDEKNCITDEGSSYSSFYSSFLKTESTSTSSDPKKPRLQLSEKEDTYVPIVAKNNPQSKRDPPWNQVTEILSLQYKYEIPMPAKYDTMKYTNAELMRLDQPLVVNTQLGQLYQNLIIEGFDPRLILEEGTTGSSSCSETNYSTGPKPQGRKRDFAKLNMIYEENAPFPSPSVSETPTDECPLPAPTDEGPLPAPTDEWPLPAPTDKDPLPAPTDEGTLSAPTDEGPLPAPTDEGPLPAPTDEGPLPAPAEMESNTCDAEVPPS